MRNDTIVNQHIQDWTENDTDSVGKKDGKLMTESKDDERDESITEHNLNQSGLHMQKYAKSMCECMIVDTNTNKEDARNDKNVGGIDAINAETCLGDDNVDDNDNVDLNIGDLQINDSESQTIHDIDNNGVI